MVRVWVGGRNFGEKKNINCVCKLGKQVLNEKLILLRAKEWKSLGTPSLKDSFLFSQTFFCKLMQKKRFLHSLLFEMKVNLSYENVQVFVWSRSS